MFTLKFNLNTNFLASSLKQNRTKHIKKGSKVLFTSFLNFINSYHLFLNFKKSKKSFLFGSVKSSGCHNVDKTAPKRWKFIFLFVLFNQIGKLPSLYK